MEQGKSLKTDQEKELLEHTDFQTMRPPYLLVGISVIMLQVLLTALSGAGAMGAYPWLSPKGAFIFLMVSGAIMCIPHFLITRGHHKTVRLVQAITIGHALFAVPQLWDSRTVTSALAVLAVATLHFRLTFSTKYVMYVFFFKVIWDRHRAQRERAIKQRSNSTEVL